MKTLRIIAVLMLLAVAAFSHAGEIATLPSAINLNTPTTDQIELDSVEFFYGATNYAILKYKVLDLNGSTIVEQQVEVAGSDFTAFVNGYGSTLNTRTKALIWTDIQSKYTLVE